MKKRTIIALIVAAALIVIGGILVVLGLSFVGDSTSKSRLTQRDVVIPKSFDNIVIDAENCDVEFVMLSGLAETQITIWEHSGVEDSETVKDDTLTIEIIDSRKWIDHIGVFNIYGQTESMKMTVYLPEAEYASLQVRTNTGDIILAQEPFFREVTLRSDTGDISCTGISGDLLDCMTSTGDVSVQNSAPNILQLQSNTGDFAVRVVAGDEIHMKTNTGDVDAENVNVRMLTCTTGTGDADLEQVLVEDYLQVFADTGDITIRNSDAKEVNIETDTGDVIVPAAWEFQRIETNTGTVKYE